MTASEINCIAAPSEKADELSGKIFPFCGQHLVASYSGCDESVLIDLPGIVQALHAAIAAAGATVLDQSQHIFPNGAVTVVMLLAESHASIHTYPEHRSCFVDLFTCGEDCDLSKFDAEMQMRLRPETANVRTFLRE